jgi:hypothetical protein
VPTNPKDLRYRRWRSSVERLLKKSFLYRECFFFVRIFFSYCPRWQDREGVGDARSASSAARTMICTVGNYFWLSAMQSSGAGRGDRRRGCFLTSREGGGLTLVHCGDMDGSAAMEGGGGFHCVAFFGCCGVTSNSYPHPLSREFGWRPDSLCVKIAGQTVCVQFVHKKHKS